MKLKKLLVTLLISVASVSSFAMSDGQAGLLGIVIGSQLMRPQTVYVQPQPVYVQPAPQVIYQQAPVIFVDPELDGYCAPYRGEQYSYCIDNIRRQRHDMYHREYREYRR